MTSRSVRSTLGVSTIVFLWFSIFAAGQVAVTTYHNDNSRSGVNSKETILTPSNVNEVQFGKRLVLPVTGYVYAQPLYVPNVNINGTLHNVVYTATEHDQVYAFDTSTGQMLWHKNFLVPPSPLKRILPISADDNGCTGVGQEIGITSTPVIDLATNQMYVIAATKEIYNNNTTFYQRMHVLDIRTGAEKLFGPYFGAPIQAKTPGTGSGSIDGYLYFDPLWENQRAALTMTNGIVIAAWGAFCDFGNFHGYVMAFNKSTLQPNGVLVTTPNGYDGGIWNSGAGAAVGSAGSIYLPTGNGLFDANVGGTDYGDSILRLSWSNNQFTIQDYFTPWDQGWLDSYDWDVGSGGVLIMPDQPGAPYPHLLVQSGKEGTIDLINRDNMGHFNAGSDNQIVQTLPMVLNTYWGAPAMWNNNLYFGGYQAPLLAFHYDPVAQQIQATPTSQTPETFDYPGPTPSVSSNGNSNGIVWVFGSDSVLRAYDANNLANEFYNSDQNPVRDQAGSILQFALPTVADGMVFIGARNELDVYGLLH